MRGQEKLSEEQKQHNNKVAKVRGIVEMPFCVATQDTRFTPHAIAGCKKNGLDFGLWVIAYNFRRSLSLLT